MSAGTEMAFAIALFQAGRTTRSITAFIASFLTSGILYGILYVLIMKAIRVNREDVEAWFERQRQRLQSGPVPVIERAHPVMIAALYAVYGRTIARRFFASFCIGLLFSGVVFAILYYEFRQIPIAVRATKSDLERKADPFLYAYATTPKLVSDYKKAFETEWIVVQAEDHAAMARVFVYSDELSKKIRGAQHDYDSHFLAVISSHPDRVSLTLLHLFEGDQFSPGFRKFDSVVLFSFNVLLDFVSITIVIESLRWLGRKLSLRRAAPSFLLAGAGMLTCCLTSFLSYSMFLRGNTRFFSQLLIWLPFSLLALTLSIAGCVSLAYGLVQKLRGGPTPVEFFVKPTGYPVDSSWEGWSIFAYLLLLALGLGWAGISGIQAIWGDWRYGLQAGIPWRDFFHAPYVLALTTFVPASLAVLAFGLMLIGKLAAEPTRVLPEAYMTFIKEEAGGTQAYGMILLLGLITGAVGGVIGAFS